MATISFEENPLKKSSSQNREISSVGYPLSIFSGKELSIGKFLCALCEFVLRNAVQSCCGHRFCKDCAENYIKTVPNAVCPLCEKDEGLEEPVLPLKHDQLFVDNAIKREMGRMDVCCYITDCDWSGCFRNLEEHTHMCGKALIDCPSCQQSLRREELSEHEAFHQSEGQLCQFGCENNVKKSQLTDHMNEFHFVHMKAIWSRIQTIHLYIGLNSQNFSGEPVSILDKISYLDRTVREIEDKLKKIMRKDVSAEASDRSGLGALETSKNEIDVKLAVIEEKLSVYEGVITVLNREVEKLSTQSEILENQLKADREFFDVIDRKIKGLERQIAIKDATIAELELKTTSLELTSYDGTLIWKISDFSRKRQEAISGRSPSIYSTPFYTSKTGYKMCARIYLNGDGMGRGTHVSVFFVIMRGQYDALLKWPFNQKVTLLFMDQNNQEHVLDAFRPDITSSSFKRPVSEMNIASGCPLFLAHTKLDDPRNGYIKDNTAFIKLMVKIDEV